MEHAAEFSGADTRFVGDVRESPVAVVVIEKIFAVLSDVKIRKTVVVVVAPDATQAIRISRRAGLFGYVSKRAIAVIPIERIAHGDAAFVTIAAVDEVNILVTVAIKIGDANAGSGLFKNDRGPIGALVVNESDSGGFGDVGELNRSCRLVRRRGLRQHGYRHRDQD